MKSISYVMVIKTQLSWSKLRIIWKIKFSVSLINGDSHSLSLFLSLSLSLSLSLPCCCQYRFKRYIAKQTNSKTEEPFSFHVSLLSRQIFCFLFVFLSMLQATKYKIRSFLFALSYPKRFQPKTSNISTSILPFFLLFCLLFRSFLFIYFFLSLKLTTKNVRDFTFTSFFLSFFKYICTHIYI